MITSMCMNMHCNIDMLYMYMAGFLLIIKVDSFSQPCDSSRQTVEVVQHCPNDPDSYRKAAARKNCSGQQHVNCSSFEYHCVLNDQENETVEVCAPSIFIIGKVCAKFNLRLKSIFRIDGRSCNESDPPCGYRYNSTESYKFSGCFDFSKPKIPIRTEKSQSLSAGGVVGIILAVLIIFAIIKSFIIWKIYQLKERNQHTWSQAVKEFFTCKEQTRVQVHVNGPDQLEDTEREETELLSDDQNTSSNVNNGQENETVQPSPSTPQTEDYIDTAIESNQSEAHVTADVGSNAVSFPLSPSKENQSVENVERKEEASNERKSNVLETKQHKLNNAQILPLVTSNSDIDRSNVKENQDFETNKKNCDIELEKNPSNSAETSRGKIQVVGDSSSHLQPSSIYEDTYQNFIPNMPVTVYYTGTRNTVTVSQPTNRNLRDPVSKEKVDDNGNVNRKKSKSMMPRESKETYNLNTIKKSFSSFQENERNESQKFEDQDMINKKVQKQLEEIKSETKKEITELREDVEELKKIRDLLEKNLKDKEMELKSLKEQNTSKSNEVETLKEKLKERDELIIQNYRIISERDKALSKKDEIIAAQGASIRTQMECSQKLLKCKEQLEQEIEGLKQELHKVSEDLNALKETRRTENE